MDDILIRGATIIDGTGAPSRVADVAVRDGQIVDVGRVDTTAKRIIDGDGRVLAPGWVDVHTHFDGQATWDPEMTPSSWHGVTTVVMGNCGVGFAPVRPEGRDFLIELMEEVEDIPGTALHEGIEWRWETFPEYLDVLDSMPRVLDVAAQVPHAALRAYVLGDRAHDDATDTEVETMAQLVEEAVRAGAVGFSTSRFAGHRSKHGLIPGTLAPHDEVLAIAEGIGRVGRGVVQMISDDLFREGVAAAPDGWLLAEAARRSRATVTFSLAQTGDSLAYREALDVASSLNAEGLSVVPQVTTRPFGFVTGLASAIHPLTFFPGFALLDEVPPAALAAELRKPEVRRLVLERPPVEHQLAQLFTRWSATYRVTDPPDYEPAPDTSAAAVAQRDGRDPGDVIVDWLTEPGGTGLVYSILGAYGSGNLDAARELLVHPLAMVGGSDAGAHCGMVSDASVPTSLLTFWVRDRTRGPRVPLEQVVHAQTQRTADAYGFTDRGVIATGKRADLNLIDLAGLRLYAPELRHDLPAGGGRLVQRVDGYELTMLAGEVTFERGEPTGARPGRLVRSR